LSLLNILVYGTGQYTIQVHSNLTVCAFAIDIGTLWSLLLWIICDFLWSSVIADYYVKFGFIYTDVNQWLLVKLNIPHIVSCSIILHVLLVLMTRTLLMKKL